MNGQVCLQDGAAEQRRVGVDEPVGRRDAQIREHPQLRRRSGRSRVHHPRDRCGTGPGIAREVLDVGSRDRERISSLVAHHPVEVADAIARVAQTPDGDGASDQIRAVATTEREVAPIEGCGIDWLGEGDLQRLHHDVARVGAHVFQVHDPRPDRIHRPLRRK